jgi:hypothetical protein
MATKMTLMRKIISHSRFNLVSRSWMRIVGNVTELGEWFTFCFKVSSLRSWRTSSCTLIWKLKATRRFKTFHSTSLVSLATNLNLKRQKLILTALYASLETGAKQSFTLSRIVLCITHLQNNFNSYPSTLKVDLELRNQFWYCQIKYKFYL